MRTIEIIPDDGKVTKKLIRLSRELDLFDDMIITVNLFSKETAIIEIDKCRYNEIIDELEIFCIENFYQIREIKEEVK